MLQMNFYYCYFIFHNNFIFLRFYKAYSYQQYCYEGNDSLIFLKPQMLATFQLKTEIENYIFFHFQIFGIQY